MSRLPSPRKITTTVLSTTPQTAIHLRPCTRVKKSATATSRSALSTSLSQTMAPPRQSRRERKAREKRGSQARRYSLRMMRRSRVASACLMSHW